jgi:hypothetical protein
VPWLASRLCFSFNALPVDLKRVAVETPQTTLARVAEAPAQGITMPQKREKSALHRFVDCCGAN